MRHYVRGCCRGRHGVRPGRKRSKHCGRRRRGRSDRARARQIAASSKRLNVRLIELMSSTVSDFLLERLSAWGVDRIYGYPGDGIDGVIGALARAKERDARIELVV